MFMEHTDRMVFTKEDADLLERYFNAVGRRPNRAFVILRTDTGTGWANGVAFLFPGVSLSEAIQEGRYLDKFADIIDPDDLGTVDFYPTDERYEAAIKDQRYAERVYPIYENGDWIYYG